MNIITADFNWFSFLIVIIGAVIGIIKSSKKRVGQEMSEPLESIFTFEEDESADSTEVREEIKEEDKKVAEILEVPNIADTTENQEEEQEVETKLQFDIRQAIISSEILNRPHF